MSRCSGPWWREFILDDPGSGLLEHPVVGFHPGLFLLLAIVATAEQEWRRWSFAHHSAPLRRLPSGPFP